MDEFINWLDKEIKSYEGLCNNTHRPELEYVVIYEKIKHLKECKNSIQTIGE